MQWQSHMILKDLKDDLQHRGEKEEDPSSSCFFVSLCYSADKTHFKQFQHPFTHHVGAQKGRSSLSSLGVSCDLRSSV